MAACAACGKRNESDARFCSGCGQPLADGFGPVTARKTVTLVFTDLTGSTAMGERLDPESIREIMTRYYETARVALERHGGTVEKFVGDAVMAAFGIPVAHEDDAVRAVRAAVDMRQALAKLNRDLAAEYEVELQVRTGVNTGEVIAGDAGAGQAFASGDAVNVAARLEQASKPGEILIGARTHALVRDAVQVETVEPLALKGKAEPVPAFRLLDVSAQTRGLARRFDLPLIGRSRELRTLLQAFERVSSGRCELALIVGEAGAGKSRVARELSDQVADRAQVLRGHCLAYGEGTELWPIEQALKTAAGIGPADSRVEARQKIGGLVPAGPDAVRVAEGLLAGLGLSQRAIEMPELFWALRSLLWSMAESEPVVLVLDDLHWAEPALLELIEHLLDARGDGGVLLVCPTRPDLFEHHPDWADVRDYATQVGLEPLKTDESELLVDELLGSSEVPAELREAVSARARGNPLFVEEIVRLLVDRGSLESQAGRWVATEQIAVDELPPSIDALLASRLDRLDRGERGALEAAAVCGETFWGGAVAEMSPGEDAKELGAALESLVSRGLTTPERSSFPGEVAFRFAHGLVRDAAYNGTRKRRRAELHERFATWIGAHTEGRAGEHHETTGFHLERAYRYLTELAPANTHARLLGRRAGEQLGLAGRSALSRDASDTAADLFSRAVSVLEAGDPARPALQLGRGEALIAGGEYEDAAGVLEGVLQDADRVGLDDVVGRARLQRAWAALYLDRDSLERVRDELTDVRGALAERGDEAGLAESWIVAGWIEIGRGNSRASLEALAMALQHAKRSDDERLEARIRGGRCGSLMHGHGSRETTLREVNETLRWARQHGPRHILELSNLCQLAVLEAMGEHFDQARQRYREALATADELGVDYWRAIVHSMAAEVELLADDLAAAEREAATWFSLVETSDPLDASTSAAWLAEVRARLGLVDEAEQLLDFAELHGAGDDLDVQIRRRVTKAKVLAARGDATAAVCVARKAVAMAKKTDWLELRGDALSALANAHRSNRELVAARQAASEALSEYTAKGDLASTRRVRHVLQSLS